MSPSLFVSVGDPSGERAVAPVLKILKEEGIELFGLGGRETENLLQKVGNVDDISATGIFEVIPKLPSILRTKRRVENFLRKNPTDLLLLVDAPGFNLRLLKKVRRFKVRKVAYFILPQVWAWKEGRRKLLEERVDLLLSVLPFEEKFFSPKKGRFFFVGHPSVERLESFLKEDFSASKSLGLKGDYFVLFLGSRKNEIKHHLEVFKEAVPKAVKEFGMEAVLLSFRRFKPLVRPFRRFARIVYLDEDPSVGYRIMKGARFGWIKSGTTAFEAALLDLPHLTFYRLGRLTYLIAKKLVKVKYIHLANLILEEMAVPELVQEKLTVSNLLDETYRLLGNEDLQKDQFRILRKLLKDKEIKTSERVAELLLETLKGQKSKRSLGSETNL